MVRESTSKPSCAHQKDGTSAPYFFRGGAIVSFQINCVSFQLFLIVSSLSLSMVNRQQGHPLSLASPSPLFALIYWRVLSPSVPYFEHNLGPNYPPSFYSFFFSHYYRLGGVGRGGESAPRTVSTGYTPTSAHTQGGGRG